MQPVCQPPPQGFKSCWAVLHCNLIPCAGITKECKHALAKFVLESSASVRVDRGWLICLLSSPPVLVAATASTGDAAGDVQLLRGCLPIGLAISGCWQRDDSSSCLSYCTKMWTESGATGTCMHLGVTESGELSASVPVVSLPESRLFNISFSLAVAKGDVPPSLLQLNTNSHLQPLNTVLSLLCSSATVLNLCYQQICVCLT